jgi:hypothetical protein
MGIFAEPGGDQRVYATREDVILREIAGEHLLVPIRHNVAQMQAIYALTGIGLAIWKLLDGTRTLRTIQEAIVEGFEVSATQAWTDLCDFVDHLEEKGLVERRC